ncbi:hypothetical protein EG835_11215, partial [bacterium]|nr:hypothetical protein [bacterium]
MGAALFLLAAGGMALAQSRVDSTAAMAAGDSARARTDSAAQSASPSGVDTTIVYTAEDSVVYSIGARTMSLYGKG